MIKGDNNFNIQQHNQQKIHDFVQLPAISGNPSESCQIVLLDREYFQTIINFIYYKLF
jgi:hypothetical protein